MSIRTALPRWLGKLRGRSPGEFATRARQAVAIAVERVGGFAGGRELTDIDLAGAFARTNFGPDNDWATLREYFQGNTRRPALAAWDDPAASGRRLRDEFPGEAAALVRVAEDILAGQYHLLGYPVLQFGSPIDWQYDPLRDRHAPRVHWSRVPFLDVRQAGDHKVIWELNRHRHLVTLALAHRVTGDPRFAREAVSQLNAWISANPPKIGINWASSLEIAIRSIAWCWCLHLLRDTPALSGRDLARVLKVLVLNGRHIEAHLSTYYAPNTHLSGEALGLLYLGCAFPELSDAARWQSTGWRILEQELPRQVRADGTYYEQSTFYQRYVADFYLHATLLGRRSTPHDGGQWLERTIAACEVLAAITRADGSIPLLGDDDGGRLLPLTSAPPTDFRPTLACASMVLKRPDLGPGPGAWWSEALVLEGPHAVLAPEADRAPRASEVFADGGLVVMRRCTHADDLLVFDAGAHGTPRTNGTHSHADALSIDVTVGGTPMVVDPGTYSYVADPQMRDHMRLASSHNGLTLGSLGTAEPASPFAWRYAADAHLANWCLAHPMDHADAYVEGFGGGTAGPRHERSVLQLAGLGWLLHDRVRGATEPAILHFHAAAGAVAQQRPGSSANLAHDGKLLRLEFGTEGGQLELLDDWVSPLYGARSRAPVLRVTVPLNAAGAVDAVTLLLPGAAATDAVVTTRRTLAGWRIHVRLPDAEWNVQLGPGNGEQGAFHTDSAASWTCVTSNTESRGRVGGTAFTSAGGPGMEGGADRWVVLEKATGRDWERREGPLNYPERVT